MLAELMVGQPGGAEKTDFDGDEGFEQVLQGECGRVGWLLTRAGRRGRERGGTRRRVRASYRHDANDEETAMERI